ARTFQRNPGRLCKTLLYQQQLTQPSFTVANYLLRSSQLMGGWFLDIFIEYLVRVVVGVIKTRGKDAWPVVKATVAESYCPAAGFGCPVAEVYYEYVVDGKLYTGIHQK